MASIWCYDTRNADGLQISEVSLCAVKSDRRISLIEGSVWVAFSRSMNLQ